MDSNLLPMDLLAARSPASAGGTLRLKVCNNLSSYEPTAIGEINSSYGSYTNPIDVSFLWPS